MSPSRPGHSKLSDGVEPCSWMAVAHGRSGLRQTHGHRAGRSPGSANEYPDFVEMTSRLRNDYFATAELRWPTRLGQEESSPVGCSKWHPSKTATNYRLPRGGWDDPNCARPTRAFSCRALREQGDRPSYPAPFFSILLVVRAYEGQGIVSRQAGKRCAGQLC